MTLTCDEDWDTIPAYLSPDFFLSLAEDPAYSFSADDAEALLVSGLDPPAVLRGVFAVAGEDGFAAYCARRPA